MSKYRIHDDFKKINFKVSLNPLVLPLIQFASKLMFDKQSVREGITHEKFIIPGYQGAEIEIEIFSPQNPEKKSSALIFIHGGAFAISAAGHHKQLICDYAIETPCMVIFIDYRLAPQYPFPYGLEDCYAAFLWLLENADRIGIDKKKIAVCGDSAGGCLAAALTQMVRDRIGKTLLFQMLVYPVTDSRLSTESMRKYFDTPVWNSKLSEKMWKLYLPEVKTLNVPEYASPMAAKSFDKLPPGYIEVSEFDCLRDEGIEYHDKLRQSGVETVLNKTEGTIHGFEINYTSKYTHKIIEQRISYMKSRFKINLE